MGVVEDYVGGMTIQKIADNNGCSCTPIRKILIKNCVKFRKCGQRYLLPEIEKFRRDCAMMRWYDLEKEYGVSWSIIKSWKVKYKMTTGKKEDREVVTEEMDGGCLLCTSHKSGKNYPRCRGGQLVVNRLWEMKNGSWPKGKLTRHLCARAWCVNPDHVVPGTPFENIVDTVLDGLGKTQIRYVNSLLARAFKENVIRFDRDGRVVRVVDGKLFNIIGKVELEVKTVYRGEFERLPEGMIEGGDARGINIALRSK